MPDAGATRASLPEAPTPQGRYVPVTVWQGLACSAGMTPRVAGVLVEQGVVGRDITTRRAAELAAIAARNALAAIASAVGGVENVTRCLQLTVFVAAAPGFADHTAVADGASAALSAALGDQGVAARAAVGVASLPGGAPVEVTVLAAVDAVGPGSG